MKQPVKITIVGKSKVGISLSFAIRQTKSYRVTKVIPARARRYPRIDSEVIILACKDDALVEVAEKALSASTSKLRLMVHVSGSQPSEVLPKIEGVGRLTLHPMQSFAKPSAALLDGIHWMVSSQDADALRWARKFTRELGGGGLIELPSDSIALYHAMTVFASNFVVLLGGAVESIGEVIGQDPRRMKRAIQPLMEQAVTNVVSNASTDVLTGPIKRKDTKTIKKHQKALKTVDPNLRSIYDAFLRYALAHGY